MYKVLIISYANWDSLMELPAVFKQAGCILDVFSVKDSWVLKNKFHDKWIESSENATVFVDELIEYVNKTGNEYNWIIPGDDIIIRLLNDRLDNENLFYKLLPLTKIENREILGSKAGFSKLCSKYNVKTPRFKIYDPNEDVKSISAYMGYPLMMKTDKSEAGTGVFKCNNEEELVNYLSKIEVKDNVVFQQFIQGYDINMEVLYKDGELIVYSYAKLLKILGNFGLSTQRLFCQNTEIIEQLTQIGRSFGINGFASIAFMYNELDKQHYLIEVDIRPNSWIFYGKFTGSDFSEGIKKIIKGDLTLVIPDATKYPKEIKICHYKKDVARLIVEKDIKGLFYWLLNKDNCWQYIPTYDKLLLKSCNTYLYLFFKDLMKNKINKVLKKGSK